MSDDPPADLPTHAHPLGPRFEEALTYAIEHHRSDRRKGTQIPYAAHLLSVAALVLEMESSEDEAIAGLLHDVIEDGGGPDAEAEIAARFGPDVARIVRAKLRQPDGLVDEGALAAAQGGLHRRRRPQAAG